MDQLSTPMMKQYQDIKKQYPDCLLFYRMGDFYELFMEDAYIGAKILDITLTGKSNGKNARIPMAGVPYHAVDSYLSRLVKAGYKVAICEQVSPPNKNALVARAVVRIVTPGTILDEKSLNKKDNNYIISLAINDDLIAISAADISTGIFQTAEFTNTNAEQIIKDELSRINPAECILPPDLYNNPDILKILKTEQGLNIYCFHDWNIFSHDAEHYLTQHFGLATIAGFGIEEKMLAQQSAASLLGYLQHTQQGAVEHIKNIIYVSPDEYMHLDHATIVNLELFSTIRDHDTRGSLLSVLDETITPMGGRELKEWIRKPLIKQATITKRHDAVKELFTDTELRNNIYKNLINISDIERMLSRLSVGIGNARDLINLRQTLQSVITIKEILTNSQTMLLKEIYSDISLQIDRVIELINKNIKEEPGVDLRNGNLIKDGVNNELDILRKKINHSKDWLQCLEKTERERTRIGSLKVRYNKIFGFYIEVSKANLSLIPDNYIRKQTLVNGERFITPELKEQEEIILTAEQRIFDLEYELYQEVLRKILEYTIEIQNAAKSIAYIDCLVDLARVSEKNMYIRPELLNNGIINIKESRHPVVEKLLDTESQFVPNDIMLDNSNQQLLLITGPNMAGKSVLIRQVALIVLMNQIGCFVPAKEAQLCIVDRVFVRSGASDVITSGLSTFMVEMVETANILHHATDNSLIIMDEIGRGTSTSDGISIAWAVAEYLVSKNTFNPKTLFATHYHELQALEKEYPDQIKNYHMAVLEENNQPVFLHTFRPGGASSSYGIAVAKLAGIPERIIRRAGELLEEMQNNNQTNNAKTDNAVPVNFIEDNTSRTNLIDHLITKEISMIDIGETTPLEALNKLADLKDKLKLMTMKAQNILEVD